MGKINAELDSKEELYFQWFLEELKAEGYIKYYTLQPTSFILCDAVTYNWEKPKPTKKEPNRVESKISSLLEGSVYTADAKIYWADKAIGVFCTGELSNPRDNRFIADYNEDRELVSHVEVKPLFDMQNMTRVFITKQKWIYQLYSIYINLVTPITLFTKMFTPNRYLFTDGGRQLRKTKHKIRTLNEYVEYMKSKNNLID